MKQTTRQQPLLDTGWKTVFSDGSAPMAAYSTMNIKTEERCFLYGPCLDVIGRKISAASSVELS
jgi:hypothetical protein